MFITATSTIIHRFFFSFSCFILVQVPQWSLASFNQSTWPGLIRASGQKLNLNSRILMYCISIIQVTSGDILTTQVAPELTHRTDHPCILSCQSARPTGLSCDVRGQHLLVRDLGHPGTKIFQEFPAADHAVLLLCGFQGYWWLVHLLCLCERGGRWLYSRAACCKRPRVSIGFLLSTFFIIFLPSVWSFSGSSWKQRFWNEAAATFFNCFQRMLNSG